MVLITKFWDPATDEYSFRKFDVKSIEAKVDNKRALLTKIGDGIFRGPPCHRDN